MKILNTGGQQLIGALYSEATMVAPSVPGEFSLHYTLTVHHSPANYSDDLRIGSAVSYFRARCRHLSQDWRALCWCVGEMYSDISIRSPCRKLDERNKCG